MEGVVKIIVVFLLLSPVWGMVAPTREVITDDGKQEEPAVQVEEPTTEVAVNPVVMEKSTEHVSDLVTQPPDVKGKNVKIVLARKEKSGKRLELVLRRKNRLGNINFDFALIVVLIIGLGLSIFKLGHECMRVINGGRNFENEILDEEWAPAAYLQRNVRNR